MDALPYYGVTDFERRFRRNSFTLHSLSRMRIFDVMPDLVWLAASYTFSIESPEVKLRGFSRSNSFFPCGCIE